MNPTELIKWRKQNGYTQISLGKALGVSTITVYRWEKEMRAIPSFLHLALKYLALKGGDLKTQGREGKDKNSKKYRKIQKNTGTLPLLKIQKYKKKI